MCAVQYLLGVSLASAPIRISPVDNQGVGPFGDIGQADHGKNLTTTVQERRFENARPAIVQGVSDEHRCIGRHGKRRQYPQVHCEDYRRDASDSHVSRHQFAQPAEAIPPAPAVFRCIRVTPNTLQPIAARY